MTLRPKTSRRDDISSAPQADGALYPTPYVGDEQARGETTP